MRYVVHKLSGTSMFGMLLWDNGEEFVLTRQKLRNITRHYFTQNNLWEILHIQEMQRWLAWTRTVLP